MGVCYFFSTMEESPDCPSPHADLEKKSDAECDKNDEPDPDFEILPPVDSITKQLNGSKLVDTNSLTNLDYLVEANPTIISDHVLAEGQSDSNQERLLSSDLDYTFNQLNPSSDLQSTQKSDYIQPVENLKEQITDKIVDYIDEQLTVLQESYRTKITDLVSEREKLSVQWRKQKREIRKMNDRNDRLSKQLTLLHSENQNLRDSISQVESMISKGSTSEEVLGVLKDIKEKLWGEAMSIAPEKKKRIVLLKRLSQTRFNPSNQKHCLLLSKLWSLHSSTPLTEGEQWKQIGFESSNPGSELGKTGILGLQNLVYFSERYTSRAKKMASTDCYKWAQAGVSLTSLLSSLLHVQGEGAESDAVSDVPLNGIINQTFVNLMDHPKAFEELYCVCFMLFDKLVQTMNIEEAHNATQQKLKELLLTDPKNLEELLQIAKDV